MVKNKNKIQKQLFADVLQDFNTGIFLWNLQNFEEHFF